MSGVSSVVTTVANAILSTLLSAVFAILYLTRMIGYSGKLSGAAILMLCIFALLSVLISRVQRKYQGKIQEISGKESSILYQYINGIAKIRMSGAEDRTLFEYMKLFVSKIQLQTKAAFISNIGSVLSIVSGSTFSIVLYAMIVKRTETISVGEFIAFTSAFGMFSGAFTQVIAEFTNLSVIKPTYERGKPILAEPPEYEDSNELPGDLSGEIKINNVNFSYAVDMPSVLDNISLNIKSGEYVGIVGPSGCGKSTLLKLLLGFETPMSGKIYYDNRDVDNLDKRELRKKLGVVLQDGKLISGSIFENITITSPSSTMKEVERVVRDVGLERDIKDMPMGLHTVLSEDCGTISGGQQQRILIARAIIGKPKILFFDEATSALDNVTQAMVCESLASMEATRIVIAHRLSTIINCDRIIVLNGGHVEEQGTYEELMANGGLFHELASRQLS
jgi:ATP-binding cassette subfamily C protein